MVSVGSNSVAGGALVFPLDGVQQWVNFYNGSGNINDFAVAVASDSQGNVFVTGYADFSGEDIRYITIAYSPTGIGLWTNYYKHLGSGNDDKATALALDDNGNVFVTGYSWNLGYYDFATLAYSSAGVALWTNRYDGPINREDRPAALAVDRNGNIFVTGFSRSSINFGEDYLTIAYSNSGVPLWTNRYNSPANNTDRSVALAVSSNGNVFVTGSSVKGNATDMVTIGYANTGESLWTNIYSGPYAGTLNQPDKGTAVAEDDNSGNVYVTGSSWFAGATGSLDDYVTIAYSPSGTALWTNRYIGERSGGSDTPTALTVDKSGNVIVTGYSAPLEGSAGYWDYLTVAYSSTGTPLWTNRYNGPGNHIDQPKGIGVDVNSNVVVTGTSTGINTGGDIVTIKYSSAGVPLWTNRYNGPASGSGSDVSSALAIDVRGNVIVTGSANGITTWYDYGTVKYCNDAFRYTPPTGFVGLDTFSYVIQDSLGMMATGTVTVTVGVLPPPTVFLPPIVTNGNFVVGYSGLPNVTYSIQTVVSLDSTNWQTTSNITASATGEILFLTPIAGSPTRFYRAVPMP